jgi:hypothetical protein
MATASGSVLSLTPHRLGQLAHHRPDVSPKRELAGQDLATVTERALLDRRPYDWIESRDDPPAFAVLHPAPSQPG